MSALFGRERELARLGSLLDDARAGTSAVLVIRGEPGIGKTTLLRTFAETATDATVTSAAGAEPGAAVPFSSLAELLLPLRQHLDDLPTYQAEVLAGALALGPHVQSDPFTTGVATLSLLAAASETGGPVIAVIDDAQWIDAESQRALRFAGRRLGAEGVLMLFAIRDVAEGLEGFEQLRLAGLDVQAVEALVEHLTGVQTTPDVSERLHRGTGGNPLAIVTAAELLAPEQLAGEEPLDRPLPVGSRLIEAVGAPLADLDEATRMAMLVAAATHSGSYATVRAALEEMGIDDQHLGEAERRGLIHLGGPTIRFRHPILRSVAYHTPDPEDRRAAHEVIARVTRGSTLREERAYHLANAAVGPDEEVAGELEAAAVRMLERSGYAGASTAYERAASFSTDEERRARRLLEAARSAQVVGRGEHALHLLDDVLARSDDPELRARAHQLRGVVAIWIEDPDVTLGTLQREAARIEETVPDVSAAMLAEAAMQSPVAGRVRLGLTLAQHAYELAPSPMTTAALGAMRMYTGSEGEARRLLSEVAPRLATRDVLSPEHPIAVFAALSLAWLYEHEQALTLIDPIILTARSASAPGLLPLPLLVRSEVDLRRGRWAAAYAGAQEAVRLADELRQLTLQPFALTTVAVLEALRGTVETSGQHLEEAAVLAERFNILGMGMFGGVARGLAALGAGRFGDAVTHLERVRLDAERLDVSSVVVAPWREHLIEAYVRDGREQDASDLLAEFERRSEQADNPHVWAVLRRCQAMLDPEMADEAFEDALSWHDRVEVPFERARTHLHYGEHLRRIKQRGDAQQQLQLALRMFEDLGATPWAERAAVELRATGAAVPASVPPGFHRLTPQELQVALAVAEGATNREVAAALFLSTKTVEYHLGKVFRKLQVRSRTELARRLTEADAEGLAG